MNVPTLTTDRLVLKPLALADFDAYASAWADPELTAFIGGRPRTRSESWTRFTQGAGLWELLGYGYWTVADRTTGVLLGTAGLADFARGIPELDGFPEAGWALIPRAWGRGLATEAVTAFLAWSDRVLPSREVRCIIEPRNVQSIRVAEKCGFTAIATIESDLGTSRLFARATAR